MVEKTTEKNDRKNGDKMLFENKMRSGKKKCIMCGLWFNADRVYVTTAALCVCKKCAGKLPLTAQKSSFPAKKYSEYIISPLFYSDFVREAILEYKFYGAYAYGEVFAELMKRLVDVEHLSGFDIMMPVPISRARMNERGYNQSAIIAERLSDALGIEFDNTSLVRLRNTKRQSSLGSVDRAVNVKGAFGMSRDLTGKRVIIFDDIYTSGFTMDECARIAAYAGAAKVIGLTLSIVDNKTDENRMIKYFK